MAIDFLPQPREVKYTEEVCHVRNLIRGFYSHLPPQYLELLPEDAPWIKLKSINAARPCLALTASLRMNDAVRPDIPALPADIPEAYFLSIEPDHVEIHANKAVGVWRGFQTLMLIARDSDGHVPCCEVRDWPAIQWRGIHLDLKGYQPTFKRLKEMIRILARYKINAILLELEDKFHYTGAPEIGIATAYTPAQLQELDTLATALDVQLIPKVQCLAHVDYILKHKRYAGLRENGHPFQFCPRNPKAHQLWRTMAGEIMACLPHQLFFHVGADESGHLNECPVCRKYSRAENYVHCVSKALDFVENEDCQPIMWEDILRNLHGHLRDQELRDTYVLGKKSVLMYWAYGYGGEHDNTFPMLPTYRQQGLRVWGASGFSGCGPRWFQSVPALVDRAANIAAWTKTAVEHGLEGVMTTGWTRIGSFDAPTEIPEACWFQMLYAADSMWSGKSRPINELCNVAARSFFGVELPEHVEFLMHLDPAKLPADPGRFKATRHADRLELLNAALDVFRHEQARSVANANVAELESAYYKVLGDRIVDYRKGLFEGQAKGLQSASLHRANTMRDILGRFYEKPTVEEFIRTRFARDAEVAAALIQKVKKSKLL